MNECGWFLSSYFISCCNKCFSRWNEASREWSFDKSSAVSMTLRNRMPRGTTTLRLRSSCRHWIATMATRVKSDARVITVLASIASRSHDEMAIDSSSFICFRDGVSLLRTACLFIRTVQYIAIFITLKCLMHIPGTVLPASYFVWKCEVD